MATYTLPGYCLLDRLFALAEPCPTIIRSTARPYRCRSARVRSCASHAVRWAWAWTISATAQRMLRRLRHRLLHRRRNGALGSHSVLHNWQSSSSAHVICWLDESRIRHRTLLRSPWLHSARVHLHARYSGPRYQAHQCEGTLRSHFRKGYARDSRNASANPGAVVGRLGIWER
ncbi:hypothetical protein CALVIDRAFT_26579 [Calocera viscosa TUFC12733]|uniref:Uncharacterized protein n=1 Tax=Calocera viscosa (strain TUFC12733) TaxID=1330018 RepID=A0A167P8M0_CALVF|nr:hypothetical protein CALVIDRAFT_26579 [Calocera viscosa TUFC12733]